MAAPASIGFIGAGHIGSALAKLAISHGHKVTLANSRGPESLASLITKLGPNAVAGTVEDAVKADLIVLTVPLHAYKCIPPEQVVGKIVIDTNNYYPDRDGKFPEIENGSTTSSELLQNFIPGAKVVKAFNNIVYFQIGSDGSKKGSHNRRALPIAGNDAAAKKVVADLMDEFGYDTVDLGPLSESKFVQPISGGEIAIGFLGSWISKQALGFVPVYGVRHNAKELRKALQANGWKPPTGDGDHDKGEKAENEVMEVKEVTEERVHYTAKEEKAKHKEEKEREKAERGKNKEKQKAAEKEEKLMYKEEKKLEKELRK